MINILSIIITSVLVFGAGFAGYKLSKPECVCNCCESAGGVRVVDNIVEEEKKEEPKEVEIEEIEEIEEIYNNHNVSGVQNTPTEPTKFTLEETRTIHSIQNYHWNNAKGNTELGEISLEDEEGNIYGPWETKGTDGQGGVKNAYWTCYPDIPLEPGTYTILDSENETWSQNSGSKGQGMTRVFALKK